MKKFLPGLTVVLGCALAQAATVTVGPWTPLYQGIDLATGQQQAGSSSEKNHRVLCLRVDLTDPDVVLFTTPRCTNCNAETLAENTSHFLEQYQLQVAINGGFYSSSIGPNDTPLGTPDDVLGLAISRGTVVSSANNAAYAAAFLFTTNNQAFYVPTNSPATNTTGIYTAISGNLPLLVNGVNVRTPIPNDLDPRTALGLSQDRRYLFLLTLDGRQPGWSDGADFYNTGEWLLRFGAYHGINVDGGGSTTMVAANCDGSASRLNRSSFVASYGRERNIGHNFGVYAKPLPSDIKDLTIIPGSTTALVTWRTDVETTTQVEYGISQSYDRLSPIDQRLLKKHVATLSGLTPGLKYFFRVSSTNAEQVWTAACQFNTLREGVATQVFGLTKTWTYTTNNLDEISWTLPTYNDGDWLGTGPALLYVENNAGVVPKNTALPPPFGQPIPRTYYFRTHFDFAGSIDGLSLTFSNYLDDGAVYYLNGTEVYRLRLPAAPAVIGNGTGATGTPCTGTAQAGDATTVCPDVFSISGDLLNALVQGDNVLAVEVHNYSTGPDIVFGMALIKNTPSLIIPRLNLWMEGNSATLFWNEEGFAVQQSSDLTSHANWSDLPGPVTQSPVEVSTSSSTFYRLRKL